MKTLFFALLIFFFLVVLFIFLYPIIKKRILRKNPIKFYYHNIYKLANAEDYYLINSLSLESNDGKALNIDHLLFGDHYIFSILDCYFDGALSYKPEDNSWVFYYGSKKSPKIKYIDNPLLINSKRINKFSLLTGLDKTYIISIVLVNDDCLFNDYVDENKTTFLIHRKCLNKIIKECENRNVPPLKKEQLTYVVHDIARLNIKK